MQQENTYALVSALFIKLLALIYFIAFASFSSRIVALAGQDGILTVVDLLELARALLVQLRLGGTAGQQHCGCHE